MLTFLELYQTLLSFVFFKIYTDTELVYPPAIDVSKDDAASGVDAYRLQNSSTENQEAEETTKTVDTDGKPIKGRDVRRTIKELANVALPPQDQSPAEVSARTTDSAEQLPYDSSLPSFPPSTTLFSSYTFYLAPGSSRPLLEFTLRSFGGRVGWPTSMGSGSPIHEDDESITHVIIDRPLTSTSARSKAHPHRKYVQPQWVVDSINAQRVLPEGPYSQGATLPPHLSPFGEEYTALISDPADAGDDEEVEDDVIEEDTEEMGQVSSAIAQATLGDDAAIRDAELVAERAGVSTEDFDARVGRLARNTTTKDKSTVTPSDLEMNKMLMSNKQRKLYEKVRHSEKKRMAEVRISSLSSFMLPCISNMSSIHRKTCWKRRGCLSVKRKPKR